jgi:hypothetical protein
MWTRWPIQSKSERYISNIPKKDEMVERGGTIVQWIFEKCKVRQARKSDYFDFHYLIIFLLYKGAEFYIILLIINFYKI